MTSRKYFNVKDFTDEFGNLKEEFEIVKFDQLADDTWVEWERFESGMTYFVIDGQIYRRLDNSLLKMNMDFESETCGACFQVSKKIEGKRKITGNEKLFTHKLNLDRGDQLTLHKQNYSDGTCFYSLQDARGNFKMGHASKDISELISQINHEVKVYEKQKLQNDNNESVSSIYDTVVQWKKDILSSLINVSQKELQLN